MTGTTSITARLSYRLVAEAPAAAVGRARTARRLAPILESAFAALGAPLYGSVVPVAHGPARGLRLLAERRSLAWISGRTEAAVQAAVTRHLGAGGAFVDIGASIGFFSLLAARIVGPSGSVVAFEPQPAAAESIRRNCALNGLGTVTVVETAVSADRGQVLLVDVGQATAHVAAGAGSNSASLRVGCTSLDAFLADRPDLSPSLVKIDVEGHEHEVLAGMRLTLDERRPVIVIECHGRVDEILAPLDDAAYAVSVLDSSLPVADAPAAAHLLAVPDSLAQGESRSSGC